METPNSIEPLNEKESVISNYMDELNEADRDFHESVVKKARNALYWVAGLLFAGEMIAMFKDGGEFNWFVLVFALAEAGIFIGFALWTRRKPYSAVMGGMIAFLVILVLGAAANAYVDGIGGAMKSLFSGIFIKAVILVNLGRALNNARQLQQIQYRSAA